MGRWREDGSGEWVWHLRSRTEWVWTLGVNPCVSESLSSLLSQPLVQTERAQLEDGRFVYRLLRSPMCEYLVNFLHKLQQLPERYMMNSVLENLTILQVVTETPRNCCSALPTSLKSPPVSGGPSTTFIVWSGTEGGPQK